MKFKLLIILLFSSIFIDNFCAHMRPARQGVRRRLDFGNGPVPGESRTLWCPPDCPRREAPTDEELEAMEYARRKNEERDKKVKFFEDKLFEAIKNKDKKLINELKLDGKSFLMYAAYTPKIQPQVLQDLIALGANVNEKNQEDVNSTALHYAALFISPEKILILLKAGADFNAKNDYPGETAEDFLIRTKDEPWVINKEDIIKSIKIIEDFKRDYFERVDQFIAAILSNNPKEIAQILFANPRINVNSQNSFGLTALSAAVQNEKLGIVRHLLSIGANPNLQDNAGTTALMLAVLRNDKQNLKEL